MELILIGTLLLVTLTLVGWQAIKVRDHKKRQRQGLVDVAEIKVVITLVQQHRGITAAWLNGDSQVINKLSEVRAKVSDKVNLICAGGIGENERWVAFKDHWQRIIKLNKNTSPTNSFDQHTAMIKNLAYLLEDTAENAHLSADYLPELANIGYVWRELILTAECVGQSRAIGTGVATQQVCSSVDKIRLNFLIQTLSQTTKHTLQNLNYLPEEKLTHVRLVESATEKLQQLIQVMSQELVNSPKISISNSHYFDLATDAMTKLNDIFDHQIKQLEYKI